MERGSHTFRDLLEEAHRTVYDPEDGEVHRTLDNKALFARLLQARARGYRSFLASFLVWLVAEHLGALPEEIETNIALRRARRQREEQKRDENVNQPPARRGKQRTRP